MPQEAAFKMMGPGRHWPDSALHRVEGWELILKLMTALFQKRDLTRIIFPNMKIVKNRFDPKLLYSSVCIQ